MVHLDVDGRRSPRSPRRRPTSSCPSMPTCAGPGCTGRPPRCRRRGCGRHRRRAADEAARPGDASYRTITATRPLFGPTSTADRAYQGFADVTTLVQQAGPGPYVGADVPAATGEDRYAGWSLVVVYRSPSLPLRNLTVFDGLADVGQNDPQSITISGFRTPVTGLVNARIGIVAYEGDRGSTGDPAVLDGTQLATPLSPGTNFFNSTDDDNGTLVTGAAPPPTAACSGSTSRTSTDPASWTTTRPRRASTSRAPASATSPASSPPRSTCSRPTSPRRARPSPTSPAARRRTPVTGRATRSRSSTVARTRR